MKLVPVLLYYLMVVGDYSLSARGPIRDPLLRWMNQIAQQQLHERQRAIDQIHTVADADRRKQKVRETLLRTSRRLARLHRAAECTNHRSDSAQGLHHREGALPKSAELLRYR